MEEVRFLTCGDCAVTVAFAQEIREDTNRKIRYLAKKLQNAGIHGLQETVPTYCSLTVYYEPLVLSRRKLEHQILHFLAAYQPDTAEKSGFSKFRSATKESLRRTWRMCAARQG